MVNSIYFRADADEQIGYGHFIRTLALADMLKDDFNCVFYTQTPSDFQKRELSKVCSYVELPANNRKFAEFIEYLKGDEIVVLDNYFYTGDYESQIRKKGCKVVIIDNLHKRHTCADAVIGFMLGISQKDYSVEPYTRLYLGTEYTLLRRPFLESLKQKHNPIIDSKDLNVVISFGGADPQRIAVSIANLLESSDRVRKITVIGNHSEGIIQSDKIIFKKSLNAEEMRESFELNDLAILPASTTMLEALACGIVIVGGYFVDNQINNYNQLVNAHSIVGCGNLSIYENQQKLKKIIETVDWENYHIVNKIIPTTIKSNIITIFQTL